MESAETKHPTPEQLEAFALGLSSPDEQRWIEAHVELCDACCQAIQQVPDDTFLGRLKSYDTPVDGADAAAAAPKDAANDVANPNAIPAELVDHPRYRIDELVGRGGMGVVYRAEHRLMQRTVAVKVVNPRLLGSRQAVSRFQCEVQAAARLAHPNIVAAYDAEQVGPLHLLVMEFVEGVNLAESVDSYGPMPIDRACEFARQAARGLQHAHERGMVHRDVKPHNLMLTQRNEIKILDFGLARFAREADTAGAGPGHQLTTSRTMLGTPDYAAPEQILDARSADIRADVYSLGCTLYFLLTGRPPFSEGTMVERMTGHLRRPPQPLNAIRADVPTQLADLVDKMLAKEPAERFATPGEVAAVLDPFCRSGADVGEKTTGRDGNVDRAAATTWAPAAQRSLAEEIAPTVALERPVVPVIDVEKRATKPPGPRRDAALPTRRTWLLGAGTLVGGGALVAVGSLLFRPDSDPIGNGSGENGSAGNGGANNGQAPIIPSSQQTPRVLLVVPYRNYWGPDVLPVRDRLAAAGVQVDIASSRRGQATPNVSESPRAYPPLDVDYLLADAAPENYDAVVFAGASPVEDIEFLHHPAAAADAQRFVQQMLARNAIVGGVCGGVGVLAHSGVLNGRQASWTEYLPRTLATQAGLVVADNDPVCQDGPFLTTGRWQDAPTFAETLARLLNSRRAAG